MTDPSERLALFALLGDLLVAVPANEVFQIRRAAETATRRIDSNLFAIDLDDLTVPGWDLGDLFKLGQCTDAWVIVEPQQSRGLPRFGLRVGRCITVQRLPKSLQIPVGAMAHRRRSLGWAFASTGINELATWPSGAVIDLGQLLSAAELEAGKRVLSRREMSA